MVAKWVEQTWYEPSRVVVYADLSWADRGWVELSWSQELPRVVDEWIMKLPSRSGLYLYNSRHEQITPELLEGASHWQRLRSRGKLLFHWIWVKNQRDSLALPPHVIRPIHVGRSEELMYFEVGHNGREFWHLFLWSLWGSTWALNTWKGAAFTPVNFKVSRFHSACYFKENDALWSPVDRLKLYLTSPHQRGMFSHMDTSKGAALTPSITSKGRVFSRLPHQRLRMSLKFVSKHISRDNCSFKFLEQCLNSALTLSLIVLFKF